MQYYTELNINAENPDLTINKQHINTLMRKHCFIENVDHVPDFESSFWLSTPGIFSQNFRARKRCIPPPCAGYDFTNRGIYRLVYTPHGARPLRARPESIEPITAAQESIDLEPPRLPPPASHRLSVPIVLYPWLNYPSVVFLEKLTF
jgi:hypothetical protein